MPVQFAGGLLRELPKGSGAADILDNWRSILCSNFSGKRVHCVLRPRLVECVVDWLSSSQIGVTPKCGVDFASHIVKLFLDTVFVFKLSGVLVFIDIRAVLLFGIAAPII